MPLAVVSRVQAVAGSSLAVSFGPGSVRKHLRVEFVGGRLASLGSRVTSIGSLVTRFRCLVMTFGRAVSSLGGLVAVGVQLVALPDLRVVRHRGLIIRPVHRLDYASWGPATTCWI